MGFGNSVTLLCSLFHRMLFLFFNMTGDGLSTVHLSAVDTFSPVTTLMLSQYLNVISV